MKFIEFEIWGHHEKIDDENQQYKNVLEDLNINTVDEIDNYWITMWLNINMLKDEVLTLTPRKEFESTNTMMEFFDGRCYIINLPVQEVIFKLNDTI